MSQEKNEQSEPLLSSVLVPVAGPEDARVTARALRRALGDQIGQVIVIHVIRKAGGAPDPASVEQMQQRADESFAAFGEAGGDWLKNLKWESEYLFDVDVVDAILEAADSKRATVIAYTPRPGSALTRWLSGDTAASLVDESQLPVLAVPNSESN